MGAFPEHRRQDGGTGLHWRQLLFRAVRIRYQLFLWLAICIAVGLTTHLLIEKPVGGFLRQRINRMKYLNRA